MTKTILIMAIAGMFLSMNKPDFMHFATIHVNETQIGIASLEGNQYPPIDTLLTDFKVGDDLLSITGNFCGGPPPTIRIDLITPTDTVQAYDLLSESIGFTATHYSALEFLSPDPESDEVVPVDIYYYYSYSSYERTVYLGTLRIDP